MKLRLRSLESKETQRLEVPSDCTLEQLKQTLSQVTSSSPSSLHLSLNRKDELQSSSSDPAPLHSLGVAAGDLIYYSRNPMAFVSVNGSESETLGGNLNLGNTDTQHSNSAETLVQESPKNEISGGLDSQPLSKDIPNTEETMQQSEEESEMDIDGVSVDVNSSEPYFLKRVLREGLDSDGSPQKIVVIAVHAVLLESGFVAIDAVSGMRIDQFHLPDEWSASTLSLWYTLPELLLKNDDNDHGIDSIVLKFQNLGHLVNIYGCLAKGESELHRVSLNKYQFAPMIDLLWANCEKNDKSYVNDESKNLSPEKEVFEFWKIVKDRLALPLLIDLCDRAGFTLPACLMRLPTELKLKILESLPGADIAKLACVCSEMRYLASNNDLWKQKFTEEFGSGSYAQAMTNWKEKFAVHWDDQKKRKRATRYPPVPRPFYFPVIRRDPNPLGYFPGMVGGDYDLIPGLGIPPLGQPGQLLPFRRFQVRRTFSPNCHLGGI